MVHNTSRGSKDNETKLARGEEVVNPVLQLGKLNVKARGNNTTLVEASVQVNNNLSGAVIINDFEFINVTYSS